jgi:hypothetical protein
MLFLSNIKNVVFNPIIYLESLNSYICLSLLLNHTI